MKRYIFTVVLLILGLCSCSKIDGGKAVFVTRNFACFDGARKNVREDVGKFQVPVNLHTSKEVSGAGETVTSTVTFKVTDGTAKEGVDYKLITKSGTLLVSNDPAVEKTGIEFEVIPFIGIKTGSKKFTIELTSISSDKVDMGPTTTIVVTILDNEGGMSNLVGRWTGTSTDTDNDEASINFEVAEYEPKPDDKYPNANLMILTGATFTDPLGNNWTSGKPLYGEFNDDTYEMMIYKPQTFAGGNFGEKYGVMYVSLGASGKGVIFTLGDDDLVLKSSLSFDLYKDEEGTSLVATGGCGTINTMVLTKN